MSANLIRIAVTGLFFGIIFVFGYWLSHSGKPYNVLVLTVHKLISLAAVIFLGIIVYQINQAAQLSAIELAVGAITALLFVGTIITGGLLSTDQSMPTAILKIHQIGPYLTLLFSAGTLYFLLSRT
jgi:hypothetical protein